MNIFPTDAQADAALFAVELEDAVAGYITGIRGKRANPVTRKQIHIYIKRFPMFASVSDDQLHSILINCIAGGRIYLVALSLSSHRRWNGAYGYLVA